jgi:hypothetical protein
MLFCREADRGKLRCPRLFPDRTNVLGLFGRQPCHNRFLQRGPSFNDPVFNDEMLNDRQLKLRG